MHSWCMSDPRKDAINTAVEQLQAAFDNASYPVQDVIMLRATEKIEEAVRFASTFDSNLLLNESAAERLQNEDGRKDFVNSLFDQLFGK